MAQLRDRQTSELLAEGSPLEVALVGQAVGFDVVLFDGVGAAFDPRAVIEAHDDHVAALRRVNADPSVETSPAVEESLAQAHDLEQRAAGDLARAASDALEAARARVA